MPIPVIIAFDDRFAPGAGVLMQSVLENTRSSVRFVLLHGDVHPENRARIEQVTADTGLATVQWIDIAEATQSLPLPWKKQTYNQMAYARLLSAELLSDKRAVYLDADTLMMGDVRELYEWELQGAVLAAAPDLGAYQRSRFDKPFGEYLQRIMGDQPPRDYFNSGVLVLDLEKCRRRRLLNEVINVIHSQERLHYADQCAMNLVLRGDFARLPTRWNTLVTYQGMIDDPRVELEVRQDVARALADPGLLHYVGGKPWTVFPTRLKSHYRVAYRRSPWGGGRRRLGGLTWRQQAFRMRLNRNEFKVTVLGKRVVHWAPSRRVA